MILINFNKIALKLLAFSCLVLTCLNSVFAQQFSLPYEGYIHSPAIYSPGYSSHEEDFTFHLGYQDYWSGFEGSPEAINLITYGRIGDNKGISLRVNNSTANILGQTHVEGGYSYSLKLGAKSFLSSGLTFGMRWMNARESKNPMNEIDPITSGLLFTKTLYNVGFGFSFKRDRFQCDVAAPELYYNQQYLTQIFSMMSYRFSVRHDIDVTPSVMYRQFSPVRGDAQLRVKGAYKDIFYIEIGYGNDVRFITGIGFNIEGFTVGYMYFNQNVLLGATNNIYLIYKLKSSKKGITFGKGKNNVAPFFTE
jgi:type IX secretion system PorP/SprF family membrane protein